MALTCAACHADNRDGARFCRGCGARLGAVATAGASGTATFAASEASAVLAAPAASVPSTAAPAEGEWTASTRPPMSPPESAATPRSDVAPVAPPAASAVLQESWPITQPMPLERQLSEAEERTVIIGTRHATTGASATSPSKRGPVSVPATFELGREIRAASSPAALPPLQRKHQTVNEKRLQRMGGVLLAAVLAIGGGWYLVSVNEEHALGVRPPSSPRPAPAVTTSTGGATAPGSNAVPEPATGVAPTAAATTGIASSTGAPMAAASPADSSNTVNPSNPANPANPANPSVMGAVGGGGSGASGSGGMADRSAAAVERAAPTSPTSSTSPPVTQAPTSGPPPAGLSTGRATATAAAEAAARRQARRPATPPPVAAAPTAASTESLPAATAPVATLPPIPSAEQACATQGFFSRQGCLVVQCAKPELRASASCDAVRRQQAIDEERRNPTMAN